MWHARWQKWLKRFSPARQPARRRPRSLRLESMEQRQLMSVAPAQAPCSLAPEPTAPPAELRMLPWEEVYVWGRCRLPSAPVLIQLPGIADPEGDEGEEEPADPMGPAPAAPDGVQVIERGTDSITVAWNDRSDNEIGFVIECWTDEGDAFEMVADVDETRFEVGGLESGKTYHFRVKALGEWEESDWSGSASGTTLVTLVGPDGLQVDRVGSDSVELSWQDRSENEVGFRLQYREAGGEWTDVELEADAQSHRVEGLKSQTAYEFRVCAVGETEDSSYTASVFATTLAPVERPAAASDLRARLSTTAATLNWGDRANNEDGYRIEWWQNGVLCGQTTVEANATQATITGLCDGSRYQFRVYAFNAAGDSPVATAGGVTQLAAATGLAVRPVSTTRTVLEWHDNSSSETAYTVEWSRDGRTWSNLATVGANVTRYEAGHLTAGGTYYFRVRAVNAVAVSAATDVERIKMPQPPNTPGAPRATNVWANKVDLRWQDRSNHEERFHVQRSRDGIHWETVAITGANGVNCRIQDLRAHTTYHFRVRAENQWGCSDWSLVVTVTTKRK